MAHGFDDARFVILGPRAVDFLSLWRINRPPIAAIVAESGPEVEALAQGRTRLLALEDRLGRRRIWSSACINELLPMLHEVFGQLTTEPWPTLIPYAASEALEHALASRWPTTRVVGPRAALRHLLDQKAVVRAELRRRGVPVVDGVVIDITGVRFAELRRRFGTPVVMQRPVGSSGLGTYFVADDRELARAVTHCGPRCLVSPFSGSCTVNVHALVGDEATIVAPPSVQLAGLSSAGVAPPIYCGNDFGAVVDLDADLLRRMEAATRQAAAWLGQLGYEGIFGIDFVTDGRTFGLLELNPRLQGSTWLLGEIQHRAGQLPMLPLAMLHGSVHRPSARQLPTVPMGGAQLILRATPTASHGAWPAIASPPGAYTLDSDRLTFVRPVWGLADCSPEEVFVGGLAAVPTWAVDPLAVVARIASWQRLVEADGRTVTPFAAAILRSLSSSGTVR
jgi:hypothetical protein